MPSFNNEGIELIDQRQKLIPMADKSDYGWKTVGEYLDNELADDDQDSKKMKKAKKRSSTENSRISRRQSREVGQLQTAAHALVGVNQVIGGMNINVLCWRLPEYNKKERS